MISNKEIAKQLKTYGELLEIHNENSFKTKSYANASFQIGRFPQLVYELSAQEIEKIPGIGKNMALHIQNIIEKNYFEALDELMAITPAGILDLLSIKGLGGSKIKLLWKEHGIDSIEKLIESINSGALSTIKGFGLKTQENIREAIEFKKNNEKKILYAQAELMTQTIIDFLKSEEVNAYSTGAFRRKDPIIECIEFVVELNIKWTTDVQEKAKKLAYGFPIIFHECTSEEVIYTLFETTTSVNKLTNIQIPKKHYVNEEDLFKQAGIPYYIPEMRNNIQVLDWSLKYNAQQIIEYTDIKGAIHNHSTWSDGINTLEEMALMCINLGFQYFGIADHSKSAVYANGLSIERVLKQLEEIDQLNKKFENFKILKGIESDILSDGTLDYPNEILEKFDYVVASIHSALKMNKEQATIRIIKAIENPYTSIIGHISTRLLLKRKGFELEYDKIFDACVANNVVIEINANPWRLDLDWTLLYDAMEKGCYFSINPDAHQTETIQDMKYGVYIARKAGVIKDKVINTYNHQDILKFL